ncbi:MAG: hypothetical protein ABIX01_19775 [Chitinophagaceae bacterium]
MSLNILQTLQQDLHYQPLQKIDPNTLEVVADNRTPDEERFSQAALPACIISLYTFSTRKDGALTILEDATDSDWAATIFEDKKPEFLEKLGAYSFNQAGAIGGKVATIFSHAVTLIKQNLNNDSQGAEHVKTLLADQRNFVLPYLPGELEMGKLLNDNSLDDRTHKMEGPVSNLMHAIGNIFSSSDEEKVQG